MKSTVFLSSLGIATASVVIGQMAAGGGGGGGDGTNIYDIQSCRVGNSGSGGFSQVGSIGTFPNGTVALGMETFGANQGNVKIPWFASPQVDHPIIAQNLYRINVDGRLEQIGLAWLKHAWFALQQGGCATCIPHGNGQMLGIGCADTYSVGNNTAQGDLGPRWEIKPNENRWMDGFSWNGSHFSQGLGHGNNVMHRLRVRMDDLDDQPSGAQYWYESVYYMLRDYGDANENDLVEFPENMFNNAAHRRTNVTYNGGTSFSFVNATSSTPGPIVQAWGDVRELASPKDDGLVYVSSRAVDVGGGNFRYEYVVMNLSLDTEVESITIPINGATVTDIGFHAPVDGYWTDATTFVNESPFDLQPWDSLVDGDSVTFSAQAPEGTLLTNTIRFATAYTFWFTADSSPAEGANQMTLIPHLPGTVNELTAGVTVPGASFVDAPLTDVAVSWGTHIGGNLNSLLISDNVRYSVNSAIGFTAQEPNITQTTVGATSPTLTGTSLRATVESRINQAGGTRKIRFKNFDTNGIVQIDTYPIGTTEITEVSTVGGGVNQFIRDNDMRVELYLRTTVVATLSVSGFIDRYDLVAIGVAE